MCSEDNSQQEEFSHRRLGEKLGLFQFSDVSPGCAFWLGPGMNIWNALSQLWRELNDREGYQEVRSPAVYDADLWRESGHWEKYREGMYHFELDGKQWGLKPMNCPGHIEIFRAKPRSYRELPFRLSEQGQVHRYEQSGAVNGLLRARAFSIDDAHLFCLESQIEAEVRSCLKLAGDVYRLFGLEVRAELSLRPEVRYGSDDLWDRAEAALRGALLAEGLSFEEEPGGGAFYGPKIDLHLKDSHNRSWQLGSVQLDYVLPGRFGLGYISADNREVVGEDSDLVIVHRAMFGSFERFIAILLEHFDGQLPLWCAPKPVVLLPRGDEDFDYAESVLRELRVKGVRAEIDSGGSLGKRIRLCEKGRVPVALIIGPAERESGSVMLRRRGGEQASMVKEAAVELLAAAVSERRLLL